MIHRQHLAAKAISEQLHASLQVVINAANSIKAHALNTRLFRKLCNDNDEEFERLLLHTQVRWLSNGKCLNRFYELFDTVVEFLQTVNAALSENVRTRRHDVAYLADIFDKSNSLIMQLQGQNVTLIKAKCAVESFISKLGLFHQNLARREFYQFPCLANHPDVSDDQILLYVDHITRLQEDMKRRFKDLTEMVVPDWIIDPFSAPVGEVEVQIQEELADLQADVEAKALFNRLGSCCFWINSTTAEKSPLMWENAKLFLIPFPTSYLVEKGFSAVTRILSKYRNRLDLVKRGDLRLLLTNLEPNIKDIIAKHEAQGSH